MGPLGKQAVLHSTYTAKSLSTGLQLATPASTIFPLRQIEKFISVSKLEFG